jgi:preprotein translocase subunit SecG
MTARGAADFLTRATSILGGTFIVLSIAMAAIAGATREPTKIDTSLAKTAAPAQQQAKPVPFQPAPNPATNQQQNQQAPAVPLAQ